MQNLKILNSREKKHILKMVDEQWGVELDTDLVFLMNSKNKVYLADRAFAEIPTEKLRLETVGMYFGMVEHETELRLSFEGSQMIGPDAKKNVVTLSKDKMIIMLQGRDIEWDGNEQGFVILRYESEKGVDFLGSGRVKEGKILNYTPKTRRIVTDDVPI